MTDSEDRRDAAPVTTIMIRIDDVSGSPPAYSVSLYGSADNGPQGDWLGAPRAVARLPPEVFADGLPIVAANVSGDPGGDPSARAVTAIREMLLAQSDISAHFASVGSYLHGLLVRDGIVDAWESLTATPPGGPRAALRLYLDVRPSALRRLPWELLRANNRIVFADPLAACSRIAPEIDLDASASEEDWPLRVMVVVGSEPDDADVDAERELAELEDALRPLEGVLDLDVARNPSQDSLLARYELIRPHLLHLIGHGGADELGNNSLKVFDKAANETWDLTTDLIQLAFAEAPPQLAVLNACRSQSCEEHEAAWMLSDAFVALGVPAIVGMQADIRGVAATHFTAGLYGALAAGKPLDAALNAARRKITLAGGTNHRDFCLPVLTLARAGDQVLRMRWAVDGEQRKKIERVHSCLKTFVDRRDTRRQVGRKIDPSPEFAATGQDILIIQGEEQAGKSFVVLCARRTLELRGRNVAYVDARSADPRDFLEVLRLVRESLCASPIHGADNAKPFNTFNNDANALLAGRPRPTDAITDHCADDGVDWADRRPGAEDIVAQIFDSFCASLRAAANGSPLIVALDHLQDLEDWSRAQVYEHLADVVARGELEPVRLMLVVGREDQLTRDLRANEPLDVPLFDRTDATELARQYAVAMNFKRAPLLDALASAWALTRRPRWRPSQLKTFGDMIEDSDLERVQTA